ncbi:unnamed protein product, partial [Prunus brigantina]
MALPMPRDAELALFSSPHTRLSLSTPFASNSTPPTMRPNTKHFWLAFVISHANFTAKDASMTAYLQHTRHLLTTFNAYLLSQVPRSENSHADALARLASAIEQGIGRNIHMEILDQPSTRAPLICAIDHSPTWMDPILQFLQNQTL